MFSDYWWFQLNIAGLWPSAIRCSCCCQIYFEEYRNRVVQLEVQGSQKEKKKRKTNLLFFHILSLTVCFVKAKPTDSGQQVSKPWLRVEPGSGSLMPDESVEVSVVIMIEGWELASVMGVSSQVRMHAYFLCFVTFASLCPETRASGGHFGFAFGEWKRLFLDCARAISSNLLWLPSRSFGPNSAGKNLHTILFFFFFFFL